MRSVLAEFERSDSTLAVMATGTGKSVVLSEIIRSVYPKRSIVIAHRKELIHQAARHVQRAGLTTEIEMANHKADASMFGNASIIVATVQTLSSDKRLKKFDPKDFGLLVLDECHHGVSPQNQKVINYFKQNPELKVFGCTATPDRADEKAMGRVFSSVAFTYDILQAIEDGYLVPIEQQMVRVGGLDFSQIRTTAGDLNGADLAAVMEDEKNLQGMTSATIEIIGQRRTIVFTASVRHAERCCDIFNRHRPGMAGWICGSTPDGEREMTLKRFGSGEIQVLVNCAIVTEGFDVPETECVVMGRPTKSRSLYCQCIGRSLRPIASVIAGEQTAEGRKSAIAGSSKPSALILDFVGNSGRHKLITTADILGGKYEDDVVEEARKKAQKAKGAVNMTEMLKESERERRERIEKAKREEEARKSRLVAKVQFTVKSVNPFDAYDLKPVHASKWDNAHVYSIKQRDILYKIGVNPDETPYRMGIQLLNEQFRRWKNNLCTAKQAALLKKHGYETKDMSMTTASKIIDALARNGWRRPMDKGVVA